jgi:hypothetical protein
MLIQVIANAKKNNSIIEASMVKINVNKCTGYNSGFAGFGYSA